MSKKHHEKEHKSEEKKEEKIQEELEKVEEEIEKEIEEESNKIMSNIWAIGIIFLLIGLVVGIIGGLAFKGNSVQTQGNAISPDEAKKIAQATAYDLIYKQLKQFGQQVNVKIEAVDAKDMGDFYNVTLKITVLGRSQDAYFYVTKDGKYVAPAVFKAVTNFDKSKAEEEMKSLYEIKNKTDKPKVVIAVMANCPFGNQVEKPLLEVLKLFGDKIEVEPRYIIYPGKNPYTGESESVNGTNYWSLHGNYELDEGVLEYVIWKLYGTQTWIEFVNKVNEQCYTSHDTKKVRECALNIAKEMGLDVNKIEQYLKEHKNEIIQHEYEVTAKEGINGSPTIIINGEVYRGPRTAEAIKEAICSAFKNPPAVCNEKLSNETAQVKGSCGN